MKGFLKISNGVVNLNEVSVIFKIREYGKLVYYIRYKGSERNVYIEEKDYCNIERALLN